jgi:hypothetical protein
VFGDVDEPRAAKGFWEAASRIVWITPWMVDRVFSIPPIRPPAPFPRTTATARTNALGGVGRLARGSARDRPKSNPAVRPAYGGRAGRCILHSSQLTSIGRQCITICMPTTLDIPEELLTEAQRLLQFKSKTDTIIFSLQELIRRKRIEELKAMAGSINLDIDLERSRRRPTNKKR